MSSHQMLLPNTGLVTQSSNSVEDQTKLILQQIQENLRKSQAQTSQAVSSGVQAFTLAHGQAPPNVSINIKQEPNQLATRSCSQQFVPTTVKTECNLIEGMIKQEPDIKPVINTALSSSGTNIYQLLTNNVQNTHVTTTVSNATTQMSLFMLANSSNVQSSSAISSSSALFVNSSVTPINSVSASTVQSSKLVPGTSMTTIQLPADLQDQLQRVQLEMRKVQASTTMTPEQKQNRLQQFQIFQKKILLKGRVLASTKSEPSQLQQTLTGQSSSTVAVAGDGLQVQPSSALLTQSSSQRIQGNTMSLQSKSQLFLHKFETKTVV